MQPKITNIIFDMGGVLIDWRPEDIAAEFSSEPKIQETFMQDILGHEDWRVWDRGGVTIDDVIENAAARTGWSLSEVERLMDLVADSLKPLEPSVELLRELKSKGKRIYCLSNMTREHYQFLKGTVRFWSMFDGLVISSLVGLSKPDLAIFKYLLDEYNLEPGACLFLDDTQENVDEAQRAGIRALRFSHAAACRRQLSELLD
jgi:putative hydrolase of the HAD superfamily